MELQNQEKNSIPPLPTADIEIRTMAEDIKSIKSGEPIPRPEISVIGIEENQNKSSFFVLAVVIGVLVLAAIIGLGAYYLASKLF